MHVLLIVLNSLKAVLNCWMNYTNMLNPTAERRLLIVNTSVTGQSLMPIRAIT